MRWRQVYLSKIGEDGLALVCKENIAFDDLLFAYDAVQYLKKSYNVSVNHHMYLGKLEQFLESVGLMQYDMVDGKIFLTEKGLNFLSHRHLDMILNKGCVIKKLEM